MAYLEILIAAVAAFLLGFGWYTALFGKLWQRETGLTEEDATKNMAMVHGLAFLMMAVLMVCINFVVNLHELQDQTFVHGAFHGAMIGAMFCAPAVAINYLYQRKSLLLFLIDVGYLVSFCALGGGILSALKLGVAG